MTGGVVFARPCQQRSILLPRWLCLMPAAALVALALPALAHQRTMLECTVWDPSDSFVNARNRPNGPTVMAKLPNGTRLVVVGISNDDQGRPWINFSIRGARENYVLQSLTTACRAD